MSHAHLVRIAKQRVRHVAGQFQNRYFVYEISMEHGARSLRRYFNFGLRIADCELADL